MCLLSVVLCCVVNIICLLVPFMTVAVEESLKKRDPDKVALSSKIKTIGRSFDLHLSIFARDDEMAGEKTLSITCFKVEKAVADVGSSPKRARIG